MLSLTFAVILVCRAIHRRACGTPIGSKLVSVLDMDVQHAGHVPVGVIPGPPLASVFCQVDCEVPVLGERIAAVVIFGTESQSLVVLHSSLDIEDPENGFMTDNANRCATCSFDLQRPLTVHPVDAVVADPDVRIRP